ncbi:hypothetical protein ACGFI9_21995 [Micromonospora sp. NPDC048930]|uniref:hypothetical protein n=1 Tax=Micromonospora sp. NPDC048930 TaxID=3364261 RepID=UPI003713AD52
MGVYPQSGLPVEVEIAPGAVLTADPGTWPWVDVTADWRLRDGLTISEGRGDWGETVDAGSIGLVFDDRSGNYSQYNPAGIWYGKLGRDTPLRVRLRRADDAFARTGTGGWQSAPSGQAWSTSGGTAGDYSTVPGEGRHSLAAVNTSRNTVVGVDLVDVTVTTTVTVPALATGAAIMPGVVARWRSNADTYMCDLLCQPSGTVQLQLRKIVAGVFTTIVAPTTVPGLTHAAGRTYGIEFRVDGDQLQARAWDNAGAKPTAWHVQATDTSHSGRSGKAGCRSILAGGNTNALPVVLSYRSFAVRVDLAGGYVPAWVPRWDQSSKDRTVAVTARGALYRLQPAGSGTPAKRSAMRRTLAHLAAAYWPCEDGDSATLVGSAIPGHPPLAPSGPVQFAPIGEVTSGNGTVWNYGTDRLANLAGGVSLSGTVPADVTAATATGWTVSFGTQMYDANAFPNAEFVFLEVRTPGGTYERWQLVFDNIAGSPTYGVKLYAITASGAVTTVLTNGGLSLSYHLDDISVWQNGANISIGYRWFGAPTGWGSTGTLAGTLAGVTQIAINPGRVSSTLAWPAGHLAVFAQHPIPVGVTVYPDGYEAYPGGYNSVDDAWRWEPAHVRLARLAAEDGIPLAMRLPDAGGAIRMGFQPIEAPLPLYRQCEDTDGGVLYERPFSLAYQPRAVRYNQQPALVLNAAGDLAEPPEPDPDGQTYRNRITVTRVDGSSATVETPEVTAGTALVYEEPIDLNVVLDDDLADLAGWRLHLASHDALRWPRLDLDLAARPDLIDAWLNCRVGSRIKAINPPADVAGQAIDVLLEGHSTTLGYKDWNVSANCSPAAPWNVAEVDGDQRVPADGSTLAADLTAVGMTLSLASTAANGVWVTGNTATNPTDFPMDVVVGGERITLSEITGTTSPQTATISARGLNGMQRSWPAGTPVDAAAPAIEPL